MKRYSLLLILCLLWIVLPFTHAQEGETETLSPAGILYRDGIALGGGVYLGENLFLTSYRSVVGEAGLRDEEGEIPLYAQLWHYDDDGVADYGEGLLDDFICEGEEEVELIPDEAMEGVYCFPYNMILPTIDDPYVSFELGDTIQWVNVNRLLLADRAHDLAVVELAHAPEGIAPAPLNALPITEETTLYRETEQVFTLVEDDPTPIVTSQEVLTPWELDYAAPNQTVEALAGEADWSGAGTLMGTPILDEDWTVRGFALGETADRLWFTPTEEWLPLLYAANEDLESTAFSTVLAAALLPEEVYGESSWGDPYAPEIGNDGIDVQHYDLNLWLDPLRVSLTGTATLDIVTTLPNLAAFTLDLQNLEPTAVRIDGVEAKFAYTFTKIGITLAEPLPFGSAIQVEIDYGGELDSVVSDFYPFAESGLISDPESPRFAMVTQPDMARTWFPCNDHPADSATYTLELTVADPFEAISNGNLLGTTPNGDGTTTFTWDMDAPMTTYLAVIAVADYTAITDTAPNGIPLTHYIYTSQNAEHLTEIFSTTGLAMEILEGYFGDYPYDTYGHVLVPMEDSALENQTMSAMPYIMAAADSEEDWWDFVVHELAHQWFGNRVRLGWWQDIWLNEGLATLAEWIAHETRYSEADAAEMRADSEEFLAEYTERVTPLGYPQADEMFSYDSYVKGGWVMQMLRSELGEEVFFTMLSAYVEAFSDQPTSTAAFFQFAEQFSGTDLSYFRWQWLEQADMPRYTLYWLVDETEVSLALCSERPEQRYWVDVPLQFEDSDGNTEEVILTLSGSDMAEGEPQNLITTLELGLVAESLVVDPDEILLDWIIEEEVDLLPTCED